MKWCIGRAPGLVVSVSVCELIVIELLLPRMVGSALSTQLSKVLPFSLVMERASVSVFSRNPEIRLSGVEVREDNETLLHSSDAHLQGNYSAL